MRSAAPLRHGKHTNHAIPVTKPLVGPDAELPLAPYTLGAWLGDGSSYHATIFSDDPQIIEMIAADGYEVKRYAAPFAYGVSARIPRITDTRRSCALCQRCFAPRMAGQRFCSRSCVSRSNASERRQQPPTCTRCGGPLGVQARAAVCRRCIRAINPNSVLRSLALFGNKHIPTLYLRASEVQRRALLAGLLDTDGCASVTGGIHFDSTNERLARDVRELALSLGYRATLVTKHATLNGRDCGPRIGCCSQRPMMYSALSASENCLLSVRRGITPKGRASATSSTCGPCQVGHFAASPSIRPVVSSSPARR